MANEAQIVKCFTHNIHYSTKYGCPYCPTFKRLYSDDAEETFIKSWTVDYWKPGHQIYEHYLKTSKKKIIEENYLQKLLSTYNLTRGNNSSGFLLN